MNVNKFFEKVKEAVYELYPHTYIEIKDHFGSMFVISIFFHKHGRATNINYAVLTDDIINYENTHYFEETIAGIIKKMNNAGYDSDTTISKVIYSDPATIVFWEDGSKTIVKRQEGDNFDYEKGLAMAICKKMNGNTGRYYDIFKKWLPDKESFDYEKMMNASNAISSITDSIIKSVREERGK